MKILYTPAAIADLQELKDYISKALHNPKTAKRITQSILNHCSNLKSHPQLGMSLAAKTGMDTDLRYLIYKHHLVMYRIEGELIPVARILDVQTDYVRVLFE